ncbi:MULTISPECIES: GNAT family N-acetyltransferase [unclassified Fusibacter]|uniref:GNAT family N-acetyltransferase n=1 Tax=unclassified Fusibacter TaxID=2624464 RepID=UPI001010475A|nr:MULTISPECIES: GNAT family N-acetyltransferase [unclassified Fusibacter]MCK8061610.1 GNAT family N-acetyltransferase [Fusibacter sp. A2]NPE23793.1 GNAT family N-acetyltransferase [Fusibacter sp. A1]RXV58698.1 GNAT family acetyltransferase [Fusibacter sp. A1]
MRLLKYDEIDEKAYEDYICEWEASGELIVPGNAKRRSENFLKQVAIWEIQATDVAGMVEQGFVTHTVYFLEDEEKLVGAIDLRHELNDRLLENGGHIGYGVRPTERGKGYATKMLAMMLSLVNEMGYEKVLITCDDDNLGSARTIENNGGVLEDKPVFEGVLTRRYWINL